MAAAWLAFAASALAQPNSGPWRHLITRTECIGRGCTTVAACRVLITEDAPEFQICDASGVNIECDAGVCTMGGLDLDMTEGSVVFVDADGALAEDNANLFWDDASDELGIGTTGPDGTLHVHEASAGTVTAHADADSLVVEGNPHAGMSLLSADAGSGRIYFGSPSDDMYAEIFAGYNSQLLGIATALAGGEIAFYAGDLSETIRIEDGEVGIGTSDPEAPLNVYVGSAGTVTANSAADDVIIESNTDAGISILTPTANKSTIYFGTPREAGGAYFQWDATNYLMSFGSTESGTEARLTAGANQEVARLEVNSTNGEMGINRTAPAYPLHVANTLTTPTLMVERANAVTAFGTPYVQLGYNEYSINRHYTIGFGYTVGSVYPAAEMGYVMTSQSGNTMGELIFGTRPDTTNVAPTERMRIDAAGHVGIGTSDPQSDLHIYGDDALVDTEAPRILLEQDGAGDAVLDFTLTGTRKWYGGIDNGDSDKFKLATTNTTPAWSSDTKLTLGTDGKVGIGISDPDGTLHVHTATAGTVAAASSYDDLVIENNANGGMSILTPDGSLGGIAFGTPTDNVSAAIQYSYGAGSPVLIIGTQIASGSIEFRTASATSAMFIDSAGDVKIGPDSTTDANAQLHVEASSGEGICIESPNGTCCDYGMYSTAPSGAECDSYWDSDLKIKCYHNGSNWVQADDWSTVCS